MLHLCTVGNAVRIASRSDAAMTAKLEARAQFLGEPPGAEHPLAEVWMQGAYNLLQEAMRELAEAKHHPNQGNRMDDDLKIELLELSVYDLQSRGLSGDQTIDAAFILRLCALAKRGLSGAGEGGSRNEME